MISVIIPIVRPEKAKRCIELVNKNAGVTDFEIISEVDEERIGCPKMVKKLVDRAKGEYICFLGDDTLPEKDFLKNALMHMWDNCPDQWGLVGINDGTGRHWLPTHWLAHVKLLDHLENREFFYTGYNHCYCDMELKDRAADLGRYSYCKDSVLRHEHPALDKNVKPDDDYNRVYSEDVKGPDRNLYFTRKLGYEVIATEVICRAKLKCKCGEIIPCNNSTYVIRKA